MKTIGLLLMASALMAQDQAVIDGPVAGFVFDGAARAIRPILGVPGSSYLGAAIEPDVDAAAIGPDGNSALVVRRGRVYRVAALRPPAVSPWRRGGRTSPGTQIDGAIAGVDRVVWSGDRAAVYSSATGKAQIVSGTAAASAIDVPGAVTVLVVNGDDLVAGIAGTGVYRLRTGSAPQLLAPARNVVGLVVAGSDLYYADSETGEIWQIPSYAAGSTPVRFAGGIDSAAALYVDGGRLWVAGGQKLTVFDRTTRAAMKTIDLAFHAAALEPTGSAGLLLMAAGERAGDPWYVLDAAQDAVWFVPAQGVQR